MGESSHHWVLGAIRKRVSVVDVEHAEARQLVVHGEKCNIQHQSKLPPPSLSFVVFCGRCAECRLSRRIATTVPSTPKAGMRNPITRARARGIVPSWRTATANRSWTMSASSTPPIRPRAPIPTFRIDVCSLVWSLQTEQSGLPEWFRLLGRLLTPASFQVLTVNCERERDAPDG